jgi:hypothetical protein
MQRVSASVGMKTPARISHPTVNWRNADLENSLKSTASDGRTALISPKIVAG